MLYCSVTMAEGASTSEGVVEAGKKYTISLDTYKNDIHGKVGHTNHGLCSATDGIRPIAEPEVQLDGPYVVEPSFPEPELKPYIPPSDDAEGE